MARFVLVHGGFSGAWIWLPLMDRLKAAGHLVEAFDLPGMGDDHTSASEVSLDSYAGRVCEVLAAVAEERGGPDATGSTAADGKPGPRKRAGRSRRTPECAYVSAVEVARCP